PTPWVSLPELLPEMVLLLIVRAAVPASTPLSDAVMPPPLAFPVAWLPVTRDPVIVTEAWPVPPPLMNSSMPPPKPNGPPAVLPVTVTLVSVAVARLSLTSWKLSLPVESSRARPPPPFRAVLPETVTVFRVRLEGPLEVLATEAAIPPPAPPAEVPLTVVLLMEIGAVPGPVLEAPAAWKPAPMPPPSLKLPMALFPSMTSPENVAVAVPDAPLTSLRFRTETDTRTPPPGAPKDAGRVPLVLSDTRLEVTDRAAEPLSWGSTAAQSPPPAKPDELSWTGIWFRGTAAAREPVLIT